MSKERERERDILLYISKNPSERDGEKKRSEKDTKKERY